MRTLLSVTGDATDGIGPALSAGADAVILDLEGRARADARRALEAALAQTGGSAGSCRLYVKMTITGETGIGSVLADVRQGALDGVLVPKVESAAMLQEADARLAELEGAAVDDGRTIDLIPLIETPKGIADAGRICRGLSRVRCLAFGAGDYCRALKLARTRDESELAHPRLALVAASRDLGLEPPIDTPYPYVDDSSHLRRICERSRSMGFQGKICIHADQVPIANAAFAVGA